MKYNVMSAVIWKAMVQKIWNPVSTYISLTVGDSITPNLLFIWNTLLNNMVSPEASISTRVTDYKTHDSITSVCEALSLPAKSIMYSRPNLTAALVWARDLGVCLTFTMSKAWLLEDVLLAAVGSCVLSLLPFCKSLITWKKNQIHFVFADVSYFWSEKFSAVAQQQEEKGNFATE